MTSYDPKCVVDHSLLADAKPHHRKAVELAMTDLYGKRQEAIIRLPASVERYVIDHMINDPRDLQIVLTMIQIAMWFIASSYVQLAVLPKDNNLSYLYLLVHMPITWIIFGQRFFLGMHYAAHRAVFSTKKIGHMASLLNGIPDIIMCNFFGLHAGTYYLHHCVMHHQANNLFPYDLSSTMPYERSSIFNFLIYVANFALHTNVYLPYYAVVKKRFGLALSYAAVWSCYLAAFYFLHKNYTLFFNISLGSAFFLGPFALMFGNYSQHIFVNPDDPTSNYGLACNLINSPFNMLTFNDGYHITHHVTSICHWSEMPLHFIKNLDKYEAGGAIILRDLTFDDLSLCAWTGDKGLRKLASHVVQITPVHKTEDELVAEFKRRMVPIGREPNSKWRVSLSKSQGSVFLAGQAMWLGFWYTGSFPHAWMWGCMAPLLHVALRFV